MEDSEKYYRKHLLSKSTFVQGKQCQKMLYLNKHKKAERKQFSKQTQVLFTFGKEFEQNFRTKFTDSFHLEEAVGKQFHLYAGYTEKLLEEKTYTTLFEAGIIYNEVLVLTDVLQLNEDGSYTVYEIKFTNKLKPVVIWDLSLQYYVCKKKLGNIESFNVVLKGQKGKFKITDLSKMLERNCEKIEQEIEEFKKLLQQENPPEVKVGQQCFRPYECVFFDYCRK